MMVLAKSDVVDTTTARSVGANQARKVRKYNEFGRAVVKYRLSAKNVRVYYLNI